MCGTRALSLGGLVLGSRIQCSPGQDVRLVLMLGGHREDQEQRGRAEVMVSRLLTFPRAL